MQFEQPQAVSEIRISEWPIIAYEATRKGWWPKSQNTDFITKHDYFADIWTANVEFYDPAKKARKRVTPSFLALQFQQGSVASSLEYPI